MYNRELYLEFSDFENRNREMKNAIDIKCSIVLFVSLFNSFSPFTLFNWKFCLTSVSTLAEYCYRHVIFLHFDIHSCKFRDSIVETRPYIFTFIQAHNFLLFILQGFENALVCIKSHTNVDPGPVAAPVVDTINDIKRLRDIATALVASHSGKFYYAVIYLKYSPLSYCPLLAR